MCYLPGPPACPQVAPPDVPGLPPPFMFLNVPAGTYVMLLSVSLQDLNTGLNSHTVKCLLTDQASAGPAFDSTEVAIADDFGGQENRRDTLTSIRRVGTSIILTYYAKEAAKLLG